MLSHMSGIGNGHLHCRFVTGVRSTHVTIFCETEQDVFEKLGFSYPESHERNCSGHLHVCNRFMQPGNRILRCWTLLHSVSVVRFTRLKVP